MGPPSVLAALLSIGRLTAEIRPHYVVAVSHFLRGPLKDYSTDTKDVGLVRDRQRLVGVLLDEKYRDAIAIDAANDPEDLRHQLGRQPE